MPLPTEPDAPFLTAGDAKTARQGQKHVPSNPADHSHRQDTLLLTHVPEASARMPEEPAKPSLPAQSAEPPGSETHFRTSDLDPLTERYELLGEAGRGSMGNVYKARDRETGETVALKLLKPEIASDQAMMERFKKEVLFARRITHKNVCRVHEFNRLGGIAYTSMEFVEGESLRSVLNRFGGLPARKAAEAALQMCSALEEAHAQGIVHRDLKPENVMIDTQGNVKIMDFGIARSMNALTKLTGSVIGTPAYMAPEQVAGKGVDFRTDIYSLGLILYEIFTGRPAFQADNAVAVALKQMRETPKPPRQIDGSIPISIERAIVKCLEKDPARRFQAVAQLTDALRAPWGSAAAEVPPAAPSFASRGSMVRPTSYFTHGTGVAPHPLYGASALSSAAPRRRSASSWILLSVLLAGGAYAAVHWDHVVRAEREYVPLTISAAKYYYAQVHSRIWPAPVESAPQPVAPVKAAQESTAHPGEQLATNQQASAGVRQAVAAPAPLPTVKPAAPAAGAQAVKPEGRKPSAPPVPDTKAAPAEIHLKKRPAPRSKAKLEKHLPVRRKNRPSLNLTPAPAARALLATSTTSAPPETVAPPLQPVTSANPHPPAQAKTVPSRADDSSDDPETLSVPPVNDHVPRYLWIGRFASEDGAEVAANEVKNLGLPVLVIPRRRPMGRFFLVLSGPFGPERVGSVMEWLKEQGFKGIRVLENPMRNGRLLRGVEQDPEN